MHDINNNNLNDTFCSPFQLTKNRHDILPRQASSGFFVQPVIRNYIKHPSIINNGVKSWNSIPFDIRQVTNKHTCQSSINHGF